MDEPSVSIGLTLSQMIFGAAGMTGAAAAILFTLGRLYQTVTRLERDMHKHMENEGEIWQDLRRLRHEVRGERENGGW